MHRSLSVSEAICCLVWVAYPSLISADEAISAKDVRNVLESRYPVKQRWKAGDFQFRADAELVELKLPHLSKGLSGARFYRTEIFSGYHEYLKVETVVMARRLEGRLTIIECRSPVFAQPSEEFVAQFRSLHAHDDREAVGVEVGKLFESITYQGSLHNGRLADGQYTVDLWHLDSRWRKLIVEFEPDGTVKTIELKNPREIPER